MKQEGLEHGGGGQGFFSGAREKLRELSRYPEPEGPTREERQQEIRQAKRADLQASHERSQTPEAMADREAKIQNVIDSLNRYADNNGGQKRSNQEVDALLKSTNADIRNTSIGSEAWSRWQEQQARAAVEAAADNVVSLDDHRKQKPDESEPAEITLAD